MFLIKDEVKDKPWIEKPTIEYWTWIDGYEGKYQVSTFGRLKSAINNIILKQSINNANYKIIALSKKTFLVHRLILKNFLPITNDKMQVNHIDENKQNNNISNLEWVTCKQNIRYSQALKIINLTTGEIFECSKDVEDKLGIKRRVCRNCITNGVKIKGDYYNYVDNPVDLEANRKRRSENRRKLYAENKKT